MPFVLFCLVLSLILWIVPNLLWARRFGGQYIKVSQLHLRRKYRFLSSLGLMIFFIAGLHMTELLNLGTDDITWLIIPALIMSNNHVLFEPYFTSDIVDDLKDFCIYLRPFDQKTNRNFFARGGLLIPEPIERLIGESLNKRVAKFYCIGAPDAAIPTALSASHIYASDDEWKNVVEKLTSKSKIVILRIMKTDGCLWEMKHCINSCLDRTIFLSDSDEGLILLKDFLLNANYEIEIPDMMCGNSKCLAVFYSFSQNRWQVVDIRSRRDVNVMIDCFVESHLKLHAELSHKFDIREVFMQPFKVRGRNGSRLWIHYLMFLMQPIWYMSYNKWPRFWWYAMVCYVLVMIILFMLMDYIFFMLVLGVSYAFFVWLAPRITVVFNSWGSERLTKEGNNVLFKWMCIYVLLVFIMTLGMPLNY